MPSVQFRIKDIKNGSRTTLKLYSRTATSSIISLKFFVSVDGRLKVKAF